MKARDFRRLLILSAILAQVGACGERRDCDLNAEAADPKTTTSPVPTVSGNAGSRPVGGLSYYYTPAQVDSGEAPGRGSFRVGGLVKPSSVQRSAGGSALRFAVTDYVQDLVVTYAGTPPDLFREGQGVIARGRLDPNGTFVAEQVLARHDESYLPREVEESLAAHQAALRAANEPGVATAGP
jgi:cytochrome c-type biogenesis protein CcmE